MELLRESRTTRKILLLQNCQSEVLVLTGSAQLETWPAELAEALKSCARRGVRVRVLCESGSLASSARAAALAEASAELRDADSAFPWLPLPRRPQGELWLFDRAELVAGACLLGAEVAHGAASYFDQRWGTNARALAFSICHKSYTLHSGKLSAREFFSCLQSAQEEISLSLPGSRVSKRVEAALHEALARGVRVTVFLNADREDAPALRRLRRLHASGATLKICGRKLSSECAVVDGNAVYMGSLPTSWRPLPAAEAPAFLLRSPGMSRELLESFESQVSVEISRHPAPRRLAFR